MPLAVPAVMPGTKFQEHAGSDKAWVWSAVDFSDEQQKVELFCIRFGNAESEFLAQHGYGVHCTLLWWSYACTRPFGVNRVYQYADLDGLR